MRGGEEVNEGCLQTLIAQDAGKVRGAEADAGVVPSERLCTHVKSGPACHQKRSDTEGFVDLVLCAFMLFIIHFR